MATDVTAAPSSEPTLIEYPESDGKPMAETPYHRDVMFDLIVGLQDWFRDDPAVYVSGNMFLYFVEGDPRRNVSPDVMLVRGIDGTRYRATYKTWEDGGKAPDLVVEVSSKSTRREDLREKMILYRDVLRVREYFLFDPLEEYLKPPFRGFRLVGGQYEPIVAEENRLPSLVLDLHLQQVGRTVRLWNPATGRIIPNRLEALTTVQNSSRRKTETIRTRGTTIREQAATLADREMTIREQAATLADREMTIRERDMTIREQTAAIADHAMTIRERDMTIREHEMTIRERDLALGRAALERDRLQAELAWLRGE